ncbi:MULTISPECIES: EamA family transporter [Neobacillus]
MVSPINYLLLGIMTLLGSFGGFFLKKASSSGKSHTHQLFIFLMIGGVLYLISSIINIYLLKKLPYTIVFPLTSVTYFWTILLSRLLLNEKITNKKLLGVVLILIGCIFLSLNR